MKASGMWVSTLVMALGLAPGLQAQTAGETADVQIIHNSPDPAAAVVDIYLDGGAMPAIEDVPFRGATGIVPLPAGTNIAIGIAPGSSTGPGDILATFNFNLTPGESYIVMAAGVLSPGSFPSNPEMIDTAFDLYAYPGLRSMGSGSDVDLIAFHGAPDAPTVDILAVGVGELFTDLAFTDYAPDYGSVPPSSYTLQVTPANEPGTVVAAYTADVSSLGGGAAVAFASGFLTPGQMNAFGLFVALTDGTVIELPLVEGETADVQIIHNSPDPTADVVDIYLDGGASPAIEDLGFREATGIVPLPAGTSIAIGIAPGNSTGPGDILATFNFNLTPGESYIVMAAGVLTPGSFPSNPDMIDTAFNLYPYEGLRTMGAGSEVDLIAFHGAPDAPTVDILAVGVGELFTDLAFTDYAPDYIPVPPGVYVLQVTPANEPGNVVESYLADVSSLGGGAAVAFASGFLTPGQTNAFGLFVALPDGTVIELQADPTPIAETSWGGIKDRYR